MRTSVPLKIYALLYQRVFRRAHGRRTDALPWLSWQRFVVYVCMLRGSLFLLLSPPSLPHSVSPFEHLDFALLSTGFTLRLMIASSLILCFLFLISLFFEWKPDIVYTVSVVSLVSVPRHIVKSLSRPVPSVEIDVLLVVGLSHLVHGS